ncbi:RimJ/RimL family protein N-acetyltransferase [Sphingomonas naasensis]|uniref:N-acetyltransferase n=1 Tax=Sphingomonas naasensis TaxID=1344951 RepID=A0A4S1WQX4_9SPHN|nr:GNAT family N-acetyltransferase [Sphingomonas naasensis]NIJ18494.1 RimJ/RimL family protein N-acetyltransferase [Sphingomonas naasensis]TGX45749.1 N-acetyltransferase [Sphingomonas naasensis]
MIETDRLILRGWHDGDRAPFHAMGQDARVMATLGPLLWRDESDALIDRLQAIFDTHGFTFWAIERRADGAFLGFCGLKPGAEDTPIEGEIEIGWRLAHEHWGQGYAREAAQASLDWGWANLDAPAIAAITSTDNARSWGLMERLGMARAPEDDFDHPNAIDRLRRHITYRIARGGVNPA